MTLALFFILGFFLFLFFTVFVFFLFTFVAFKESTFQGSTLKDYEKILEPQSKNMICNHQLKDPFLTHVHIISIS